MGNSTKKQLSLLQSIKPRAEWTADTRAILVSQIKAQGAPIKKPRITSGVTAYTQGAVGSIYHYTLGPIISPLASHPGALMMALIAFLFSGSVVGIVSQGSLPGDSLYSVKRTGEDIQTAFVSNDQKAASDIAFIDTRLKELQALTEQPLDDTEKSKRVDEVVNEVASHLSKAQNHLEEIKSTQEAHKVVSLASLITEKTTKVQEALTKTTESLPLSVQKTSQVAVANAAAVTQEAGGKALEVIVDKKEAAGVSEAEVTNQIEQKIKEAEKQVDAVKERIATTSSPQGSTTKDTQGKASTSLDQAKASLAKKDYRLALSKLTESKELVKTAKKELDKEKVDKDAQDQKAKDAVDEKAPPQPEPASPDPSKPIDGKIKTPDIVPPK